MGTETKWTSADADMAADALKAAGAQNVRVGYNASGAPLYVSCYYSRENWTLFFKGPLPADWKAWAAETLASCVGGAAGSDDDDQIGEEG